MARFTAKQYATALFESLKEVKALPVGRQASHEDAIIKSFASILAKHYDRSLLPKILAQFKKLERSHGGAHEVIVTSARSLDRSVIKDILEKVGKNSRIKEVVDPLVLGGMKVLVNDELVVDGTYRTRILRLVESVVRAHA